MADLVLLSRDAFDHLTCRPCKEAIDRSGVGVPAELCAECVERIRNAEPPGVVS